MWWWWCALYALARGVLDRVFPNTFIKGWPTSSYIVALAHQLVVLPVLWWWYHDVSSCFLSSSAYFASDMVMNYNHFDRAHMLHHVVSLALISMGPRILPQETLYISTRWLVLLELGSSGISLTGLTGRFYSVRLYVYAVTRLLVVAHTVFVFSTVRNTATTVCCLVSVPLIAHNMCVLKYMMKHN